MPNVGIMPATAIAPVITGLADELRALYDEARASMGEADLEHVREVVVETITFDSVAYFDEPAPEPERFVHARCEVLR